MSHTDREASEKFVSSQRGVCGPLAAAFAAPASASEPLGVTGHQHIHQIVPQSHQLFVTSCKDSRLDTLKFDSQNCLCLVFVTEISWSDTKNVHILYSILKNE